MRALDSRGRRRDPLRRRVRAVDRRDRGWGRGRAQPRLVLLRQRHRVVGRRRRRPRSTRATVSGGTTATGPRRCACPRSSARGRSRSPDGRTSATSRSRWRSRVPATEEPCREAARALGDAGLGAHIRSLGEEERRPADAPKLLVGQWDAAAPRLRWLRCWRRARPASGVFADFERSASGWELEALDARAESARTLGGRAGLVAALRPGEDPAHLARHRNRRGGSRSRRRTAGRGRPARPLRGRQRKPTPAPSRCRRRAPDEVAARLRAPVADRSSDVGAPAALAYFGAIAVVALQLHQPDRPRRRRRGRRRGRRRRATPAAALAAAARYGLLLRRRVRRRQRRSPRSAGRRSWCAASTCRCSARSTSAPRRSPRAWCSPARDRRRDARVRRAVGDGRPRPAAAAVAAGGAALGARPRPWSRGWCRWRPATTPASARPRCCAARRPRPSGAAATLRRLVAGSLDRAIDVAATLELRGYARGGAAARRLAARGPALAPVRRCGRGAAGAWPWRRGWPGSGSSTPTRSVSLDADAATIAFALAIPALAALPFAPPLPAPRRRRLPREAARA